MKRLLTGTALSALLAAAGGASASAATIKSCQFNAVTIRSTGATCSLATTVFEDAYQLRETEGEHAKFRTRANIGWVGWKCLSQGHGWALCLSNRQLDLVVQFN